VALRARTQLEIDIMNTKHQTGFRIVSEDEQAIAFLEDWISFAEELTRRYGLAPESTTGRRSVPAASWMLTRTAAGTRCSTEST